MNVYNVKKAKAPDPFVHWFDREMFHGGQVLPFPDDLKRIDERKSMRLWRNAFYIPKIFAPHTSLIVHEALAKQLSALGALTIPVIFAKVFNVEYMTGKEGYKKSGFPTDWHDMMDYIDQIADPVASESESKGEYFEVLSPLLNSFTPSSPVMTIDVLNMYGKMENFQLSEALLREYPVTWADGFILSETAFDICDAEFDRRFFTIKKLVANRD